MKDLILVNANIFLGDEKGTFLPLTSIKIHDKRIVEIGNNINKNKCKIIDLNGRYITPGLINLHAHLPSSGKNYNPNKDSKKLVRLIENHKLLHFIGRSLGKNSAKEALMGGITTVRAVGGVSHFDTEVRDYINKHPKKGARLFVSDYALTANNGHMVGTVSRNVSSLEEGYKMIDDLKKHNVDFIKLMITGGVLDAKKKGEPGEVKMDKELVIKLVEYAHLLGLKVASHVESVEGAKIALDAGIDTIEHGAFLDEEMIAKFKQNNSAFVSTLTPGLPLGILPNNPFNLPEIGLYNSKYVENMMIEGTKQGLTNKILMGIGNDAGCPFITHYNLWLELEMLHKYCNVSREYALYIATESNAKILGKNDIIGSIEVGKLADLVVLNNNPIDNFNAYQNIHMVIKEGNIISHPYVKRNKNVDSIINEVNSINITEIIKEINA